MFNMYKWMKRGKKNQKQEPEPEKIQPEKVNDEPEQIQPEETQAKQVVSFWNVFNFCEEIEFAECNHCGYEIDTTGFPFIIPETCPGCGAIMEHIYTVD